MKELNENELDKVAGGKAEETTLNGDGGNEKKNSYLCFDCGKTWTSDTVSFECPHCHSNKFGMCQ